MPYSGFVVPETGELIVNTPEWFNYETVIKLLREFMAEYKTDDRLYLVLDNAPWHKKAVRLIQTENLPEYQDIRDRMTLLFLPPYSPDLNPIEQCWRVTRREITHNTYFKNAKVLKTTLDTWFSGFNVPNAKIASLCQFKHN